MKSTVSISPHNKWHTVDACLGDPPAHSQARGAPGQPARPRPRPCCRSGNRAACAGAANLAASARPGGRRDNVACETCVAGAQWRLLGGWQPTSGGPGRGQQQRAGRVATHQLRCSSCYELSLRSCLRLHPGVARIPWRRVSQVRALALPTSASTATQTRGPGRAMCLSTSRPRSSPVPSSGPQTTSSAASLTLMQTQVRQLLTAGIYLPALQLCRRRDDACVTRPPAVTPATPCHVCGRRGWHGCLPACRAAKLDSAFDPADGKHKEVIKTHVTVRQLRLAGHSGWLKGALAALHRL